jgi:hypothetical protein
MRYWIIALLLLCLLLAGCSAQPEEPGDLNTAPVEATQPDPVSPKPSIQEEEPQQGETASCLSDPAHPIAMQIAAEYPEITSYQQIMDWFCSGFEFEDILTALQTEEISDYPADILLTMLEYGQSWEEIWIEIGLE